MAIPPSINREQVLEAIREVDRDGVPRGREARKFQILHEGRSYPPKYVLSLATRHTTGTLLEPAVFSGGHEANSFLHSLGFRVVEMHVADRPETRERDVGTSAESPPRVAPSRRHSERCPECKVAIKALLTALYGRVEVNHKLSFGARLEDFQRMAVFPQLCRIHSALQKFRGHANFVRTQSLPRCDFYVPAGNFIVEFDESQHFTKCRALALREYPRNVPVGFDKLKWIELCDKIAASDPDPPYRDEQRAWYDSLRDFCAEVGGLRPTVRLYAGEQQWCVLDVETFRQILAERTDFWKLQFESPKEQAVVGRLIVAGPWLGQVDLARRLLHDVSEEWSLGYPVQFLTTCGGFLQFNWPDSLPRQRNRRSPDAKDMELLVAQAASVCRQLLSPELLQRLGRCARYLTLGIDSYKERISLTGNYIGQPHVEFVCMVNLSNGAMHWTGKSYPTPAQEPGLLRVTDLASHFPVVDGEPVMILGCHDLTMYNPRSDAVARGWRRELKDEFRRIARACGPCLVLQHPHTTIKRMTWRHAWNALRRELPTVHHHAGSGRYSREDSGWESRDGLAETLAATRSDGVLDIAAHLAAM